MLAECVVQLLSKLVCLLLDGACLLHTLSWSIHNLQPKIMQFVWNFLSGAKHNSILRPNINQSSTGVEE